MFKKGEYIVYGSTGVCEVIDISVPENLTYAQGDRLYYTLKPVFRKETIYIPVDTTVFMRPVITAAEAEELIARIPDIKEDESSDKDHRTMAESYKTSLKSHECEDLIRLIKTVYTRSRKMIDNGKRPGQTDIQFMRQAEELLYGELSVVTGIPIEGIPDYIAKRIQHNE